MKKRILIVLVFVLVLSNIAFSLTLADLNIEEKILVEDAVLAEDTEITPATFESLEGVKYEVVIRTEGYIIVRIGDKFVIIQKD